MEVYAAQYIKACDGVMKGEPLSFADELVMDDVFQLAPAAPLQVLTLLADQVGLRPLDAPTHDLHLDSCITLMGPDGATQEALILVEVATETVIEIYLLPLGELLAQIPYRLVGIARHTATRRFAEAASGSFARGTQIAMADGQMRAIEQLMPGDMILTRDAGRQPIRHVTQTTLRATGSFAPVVITKGALNNANDLVLRPDHRLFVYQRTDALGTGRAEVLVKARHLVDQETVFRRRGGYIDYFQLILDHHHIIYAEGIAAESHLVDPRTRAALPDDISTPNHPSAHHLAYEVKGSLLPQREAVALLRQAST